MSDAEDRLEKTLQAWENDCFAREIEARCIPGLPSKALEHVTRWRRLRHTILDGATTQLDARHWTNTVEFRDSYPRLSDMDLFPIELFEWRRKSSRIFHLDPWYTQVLASASLENMQWKDVHWPFDAFVVSLEAPLEMQFYTGEWIPFDTLMVSKIPGFANEELWSLRLLRKTPDGIDLFSVRANVNRLKRLCKEETLNELQNSCNKSNHDVTGMPRLDWAGRVTFCIRAVTNHQRQPFVLNQTM